VLEKVFPVDEVQVVAPRVSLLGKDTSKRLDMSTVKTILARPEVGSAVPRMNLAFPAAGRGSFEGTDLRFEVGGFADGVDASFVQDDERIRDLFKDWDAEKGDPHRVACIPPPPDPDDPVRHATKRTPHVRPREADRRTAPTAAFYRDNATKAMPPPTTSAATPTTTAMSHCGRAAGIPAMSPMSSLR